MEEARSILITYRGNMKGQRYMVDTGKREVHDLFNVKTNCQINDIMEDGGDRPFPSLISAHKAGYRDCIWCIGGSRRD
ncbi:hypothetical protein [Fulvivirga imtechensis]|nr:hypothetical protein [Fulvivirga imtechensis]